MDNLLLPCLLLHYPCCNVVMPSSCRACSKRYACWRFKRCCIQSHHAEICSSPQYWARVSSRACQHAADLQPVAHLCRKLCDREISVMFSSMRVCHNTTSVLTVLLCLHGVDYRYHAVLSSYSTKHCKHCVSWTDLSRLQCGQSNVHNVTAGIQLWASATELTWPMHYCNIPYKDWTKQTEHLPSLVVPAGLVWSQAAVRHVPMRHET